MKTLVRNYDSFPALFNELLTPSLQEKTVTPSANIKENEGSFEIELAIPGFKKDDLKIEVQENTLVISSVQNSEKEEVKENFIRKEFSYSTFSRSFRLPKTVDSDLINAVYENGVLNLSIPKKEEAKSKEPRLISVN